MGVGVKMYGDREGVMRKGFGAAVTASVLRQPERPKARIVSA
jgi:hypothetical protein